MAWTDERVEQLKQLWGEGLSASQIAGTMGGVTRNAVIGKVHRLGLAGRATPAAPIPKAVVPCAEESDARLGSICLESLSLDSDRPTVSTIGSNQCKWPIGDPASDDFHFCGQSSPSGKPYCAYHGQLAFQPSAPRRDLGRRMPASLPMPKKVAI